VLILFLAEPRLLSSTPALTTSSHVLPSFRFPPATAELLSRRFPTAQVHAVLQTPPRPLHFRHVDPSLQQRACTTTPSCLRAPAKATRKRDPGLKRGHCLHVEHRTTYSAANMDINSLLSPQDSPARETPPPHPALASPSLQSPSKRAIRQIPSRTASGLSQQITSSPQPQSQSQLQSQLQSQPHAQAHPQGAYQQISSPGLASFTNGARGIHSGTATPLSERPLHSPHDAHMTPPHPLHRNTSTASMDALAGWWIFHTQS
jgi:hypothetical protein